MPYASWDGTALQAAFISGVLDTPVLELLIRKGAKVDAEAGPSGTALVAAIQSGYPAAVALLLKHGADPKVNYLASSHGSNGRQQITADADLTAVGYAVSARENNLGLVKLLLEAGSRLGTVTPEGATLLVEASQDHSARLVSFLIEKGLSPKQPSIDGITPLHAAALDGGLQRTEKIQLLLEAGADILACCEKSKNVLHYLSQNISTDLYGDYGDTGLLLEAGADPRCLDQDGLTPIHAASQRGRYQIVSALLKFTGNTMVHARDNLGRTPLHLAAQANRAETVAILLNASADANCKDFSGRTPLHLAAATDSEEAVQHLLDCGARVGTKDRFIFGRTAEDLAATNECIGVVQLLRDQSRADGVKARQRFMRSCLFVYFPAIFVSFLLYCLSASQG
jgi:ankyrin repeat protein